MNRRPDGENMALHLAMGVKITTGAGIGEAIWIALSDLGDGGNG